jgi:hypothetical protein
MGVIQKMVYRKNIPLEESTTRTLSKIKHSLPRKGNLSISLGNTRLVRFSLQYELTARKGPKSNATA